MRTGIKRVLSMNSHTTNAYPITKEVYNYLLPVYEQGAVCREGRKILVFRQLLGL